MTVRVLGLALLAAAASGACAGYNGDIGILNMGTRAVPVASLARAGAPPLPLLPGEKKGYSAVGVSDDGAIAVVNLQETAGRQRPVAVALSASGIGDSVALAIPPGGLSATAVGISGEYIVGFFMKKTPAGTGRLPVRWKIGTWAFEQVDSGDRFATLIGCNGSPMGGYNVLQVHADRNHSDTFVLIGGLNFSGFTATRCRGPLVSGVVSTQPLSAAYIAGSSLLNLSSAGLTDNVRCADVADIPGIGVVAAGRDQMRGVVWVSGQPATIDMGAHALNGTVVEFNLVVPPKEGQSPVLVVQVDRGDGLFDLYAATVSIS